MHGQHGQYGQQGQYGQYGQQGQYGAYQRPGPYQQPPKRSHTGLIIGLSVGAAVALLAAGLAVLGLIGSSGRAAARADGDVTPAATVPATPSPSSPGPEPAPAALPVTVKIPGSVAGYKQMRGSIAKRSVTDMRRKMGNSASAQTKIALYTKGSSHLVFVGVSGADEPGAAAELADSPSAAVDSVFSGSGVNDPKDFPTGSVGGVLRCGKMRQQGISVAICAWADSSALLALHADLVTPKRLSAILLSFHAASVRPVIAGA